MSKMFKKNISLYIFVVSLCSFLQVTDANANFEMKQPQYVIPTVMLAEENMMAVHRAVFSVDESAEKNKEFIDVKFEKAVGYRTNSSRVARIGSDLKIFFRNVFSSVFRWFSSIARVI
ncbi:hypothetical protein [Bartonella sp. B17]